MRRPAATLFAIAAFVVFLPSAEVAAQTQPEPSKVQQPKVDESEASDDFDFGEDDKDDKAPRKTDTANEADDEFDFGEEESGQKRAATPVAKPLPPEEPGPFARSAFSLTGFLRTEWGLWVERFTDDAYNNNPFAKARQSLDLAFRYKWKALRVQLTGHLEYDFAYLYQRETYDNATLEAYEWLVNTREALIGYSAGNFEITVGRQIVAWGQGEMFSPIDVVNPRDQREPGLSDLDDIRQPVLATRLAFFPGNHRIELMVVHESNFGLRSPPLGPFSALESFMETEMTAMLNAMGLPLALKDALLAKQWSYAHRQGGFSTHSQQVFFRWVYKGEGVDLGACVASLLDQQGVIGIDANAFLNPDPNAPVVIELDHKRYQMLGTYGAYPFSNFVLKWEVSADLEKPVNTQIEGNQLALAVERTHVLNTMVGLTWTGVENFVLGLEIWKPWVLLPPENTMLFDLNAPYFGLRASYTLLDERLQLTLVATLVGPSIQDGEVDILGFLARLEAQYEIIDALHITAGYVTYWPGHRFGPFLGFDKHDRFFAQLRWDFQIL